MEATIATENTNAPVRENDGPRINREIKAKEVRLINYNGENAGVVSLAEALKIAQEVGLDLIEISPPRRSARFLIMANINMKCRRRRTKPKRTKRS